MPDLSQVIQDAIQDDTAEVVDTAPIEVQTAAVGGITPSSLLTENKDELIPKPSASSTTNTTETSQNAISNASELQSQELDDSTTTVETISSAFNLNVGPRIYDAVQRKLTTQTDANFDVDEYFSEVKDLVPTDTRPAYTGVRSREEAQLLTEDILEREQDQKVLQSKGVGGVVAQLAAGLIDVDAFLIPFGGAAVKGASLGARISTAAVRGGVEGAAFATVETLVDPLADTKDVVLGALTGVVLGSVGSLAGRNANKSVASVSKDYPSAVDDLPDASIDNPEVGTPYFDAPDDPDAAARVFNPDDEQSLGAASTSNDGIDTDDLNTEHKKLFDAARERVRKEGIAVRYEDTDLRTDSATARTAKRLSDALSTQTLILGAKNVYDRFTQDGGVLELITGHDLFESASGRVRNSSTAAILQSTYLNKLDGTSIKQMNAAYTGWAKNKNIGALSQTSLEQRKRFDREVIAEQNARFHDGKGASEDPFVIEAADAWQNNANLAQDIKKGRDGELSVTGSEDAKHVDGYISQAWHGAAVRNTLNKLKSTKSISTKVAKSQLVDLFVKGYRKTYPDLTDAQRTVIGKAVLRRALASNEGVDENLLRAVDADGRDFLRQALEDNNVDKKAIDNLIDTLAGKSEQKGQLDSNKSRRHIDLRITDGEVSLMDLTDTNLTSSVSTYNRSVAGASALARKGIQNKGQRSSLIDAIQAERAARGLPENRQYITDSFTHFDGGAVGGGISPTVSRLKRLTNLVLLNQMGLTQLAETGIQISAVGMGTWQRHAKKTLTQLRKDGKEGELAKELRVQGGNLTDEHLIHRNELMLDELKAESAGELDSFLNTLDNVLIKGQRVQGYISGFYKVKEFQQQVAVTSMADKIMQRLRDGVDEEALLNIGIDPSRFKKYVDKAEFDADGYTDRINMADWDVEDADAFAVALHRHTRQVVQQALAGEESLWMSTTIGSMYFHLKSFPLLAMQKQTIQAAQNGGTVLAATVASSLATAGLVYSARQVINGKGEDLSPESALKGAMGLSNQLGWIPMLVDPAATVLGLDALVFNDYGKADVNTGILSTPAILPTLNKLGHVPAALNPTSELGQNARIQALRALPLVGNAVGMSALFNSLKE